jgi:hypothetical protein
MRKIASIQIIEAVNPMHVREIPQTSMLENFH